MSMIQSDFPLQFANYKKDITDEELNGAYGEYGMTFETLAQAKRALLNMGFRPDIRHKNRWQRIDEEAILTPIRELCIVRDKHMPNKYRTTSILITFIPLDIMQHQCLFLRVRA